MCDSAGEVIHLPINIDGDVDGAISCSDNDVLFQNKQNKVNSLHSTEYYKITYNSERKSNALSQKNTNDQAAVYGFDATYNGNMRNFKDHNYSDTFKCGKIENISHQIKKENYPEHGGINKNISLSSLKTDKSLFEIKNINDLKRVLPKVKLLNDQIDTLNDLSKTHLTKSLSNFTTSEVTTQRYKLKDYCRTCAGLKIPLVDIFSEKGIQMRLIQQMKHLENIEKHDNLSTQMCMDCICDLKMSYKFFMQIKKAQVKLKSIYEASNLPSVHSAEHRSTTPSLKSSSSEKSFSKNNDNSNIYIEKTNENQLLSDSKKNDPVHTENKTKSKQLYELPQSNSGYDSIEEFDPDNAQIQSETIESDIMTIDNNDWKNSKCDRVVYIKENFCTVETSKKSNEFDTNTGDTTIYQYDTELDTYIKLDSFEGVTKMKSVCEIDSSQLFSVSSETPQSTENLQTANNEIKETSKHPSILKRKISVCDKQTNSINLLQQDNDLQMIKESKIHKLNTLSVSPSDEQGIMYVTVKGSKPNELLLVKVKKMDKADEKKDDNNLHKKITETKTVDKTCGFKNIIFKDKYNIRSKELENRGAIIEEQIEEYKKKREKILGGISNNSSSDINNTYVETKNSENEQCPILDSNKITSIQTIHNEEWELLENINDQSDNAILYLDNNVNTTEKIEQNVIEKYVDSSMLKQKSDQIKNKKLFCQKTAYESSSEQSIEKLSRLLGEKEKNLQNFQDYLKQRKIIIGRLKDNDILSLYENCTFNDIESSNTTTVSQNAISDLQNEVDSTQNSIFDCDYCLNTFNTRETLEEHFKIHDYKLFYFCEDCNSEFLTNKAKRSHSITCLKKLICNYCNLMLESKGKKRQHEQKHCDAIYGQLCDVCGEKFKHQGTLDQHIKTQHMSWEKIFQCPKCPKKFAFKQKLTFHVKSVHTTLRAYLCEDCGADFKNPASLRHHRIRKHQPTSNKRECQVCHKLVPFYSLSKHMYTHKAYTIQCPHCDKMFKNSSTLKQHLRIHEDQRQYRCDTCGVGFNRRDGLRLHMRVHQKSDSRALKECSCQICSEKFPNHSMLVIHRNRVHKDGKQYTCHICNRSMLSTRSLEWHMSHIHNEIPVGMADEQSDVIVEKKRVSCNHCNKTFKTEMILRTHIKNTHMEKNPVKCADCDLKFTSEVRLRHHMMITHNRLEGTLTCPHCPKRFVNQLRLKTHMISHSEERPYTCEICGFNLKTKIQLIKHHQNRHSDERPLQCRYCPWRCKQVSALVCHERTHTNERPYSCIVCKQRFKYLGDKNKHERRHESLGGSGFKRIVAGRNIKNIRNSHHDTGETTSVSDQEQMDLQEGEYDTNPEADLTMERHYEIEANEEFENKYNVENQEIIKFEIAENIKEDYNHTTNYEQQEFEETSQEASEAAEVIMSIEDTAVYTEEVTADNIEHAEMISNQILRTGTVVHLQQQDDTGKIQMIPVMLSLPDLTDDSTTEVNLSSASIVYDS